MANLYNEYFKINPKYFPQVTEALIKKGEVSWKNYFANDSFIKILSQTIDMINGVATKSLFTWGPYGSGKSHLILTLTSMMKASDKEIEEYFTDQKPYSFARQPKKALQEARKTIAECINCLPEEIFFTSGGTESDNWALKGSVFADEQKRAVITSAIEHHAVLNSCKFIEMIGTPVAYLNPDNTGTITVEELKSLITNRTRLVSVMFANNEIGTIQPIKALAEIAHNNGALFHTDAVQAIGHIEIDVQKLGVDMLSASAHKFNGPKGIGFLYIKKGTDILPYIHGGSQESSNRAGTENIAAIVGMAIALKNNCDNMVKNQEHVKSLEKLLLSELEKNSVDYIRNGTNQLPGNISLSFKGYSGEAILHRLDLKGIEISTGSACDSVNIQVSHVLRAIQLDKEYAEGTIRISFGKNNTVDDVEFIVEELIKIVQVP